MAEEANRHFKQLIGGAPAETLATLGEALLLLGRQRRGEAVDAAAALRQAALELARWLGRQRTAQLTPEQRLFLASGALAGSVSVKDEQGQPVQLELIDTELYERLLAADAAADALIIGQTGDAPLADGNLPLPATALRAFLYPERRWRLLASSELPPFDISHPGRYRPPQPAAGGRAGGAAGASPESETSETGRAVVASASASDAARLQAALAEVRQQAVQEQQRLARALRLLADGMRGERLASVLKELTQFNQFAAGALDQLADPQRAAGVELPLAPERHPALMVVKELQGELLGAMDALLDAQRRLLECLARQQQLMRLLGALSSAAAKAPPEGAPGAGAAPAPAAVASSAASGTEQFTPDQLRKLDADQTAIAQMMTQCLINHPQRTAWTGSRVLLHEQFDKLGAPPEDCLATPPAVLASLAKIQRLHPDCFPLDAGGQPLLPPVVIEPGVGVVRWLDDRFLLSFVCSDLPRPGPLLSLSPLDQALLRIYGGFLTRGDIFNYRGERLSGSFMAEYAGEVEQKVAVKYTGAEKKITYGTAAEEKDASNREDAVRDYVDFVFCVFNGLPLPKRMSARKAGVLLKYCLFRDPAFTAALALHLVAPSEPLAARQIVQRHTRHDAAQIVALTQQALDASPILQTRYRRDLATCLLAIFGHEFVDDARDAGLLGGSPSAVASKRTDGEGMPAAATAAPTGEPDSGAAATGRSYFDL